MIDPAGRLHTLATADGIVSVTGRGQPPKSQSFAAVLSDKLASPIKSQPQNTELPARLPVSQQSVVGQDPGGDGDSASVAQSQPQPPDLITGFAIAYPGTASSGTASSAGSGTAVSAGTAGTEASPQTAASFDDAYWAQQPPAVQQLRDIQNPTERAQVAEQLAEQGYSIDVPIMVWGWDPATTTAAREAMGYTWVPSALQQPVEVAPGLSFAGTAYNPENPPPGSITV